MLPRQSEAAFMRRVVQSWSNSFRSHETARLAEVIDDNFR